MSNFKQSSLNPKNWFLKGKDKARFKATKTYYGENLERALADIDHTSESDGLKLAHLEIDKKYNRISNTDYEKNKATVLGEPYVTVIKVHFTGEKSSDNFFELDWNQEFVKHLIDAGYVAETQELVVKLWFDKICAEIAKENGAVFPDEMEEFAHKTARRIKSENGKV